MEKKTSLMLVAVAFMATVIAGADPEVNKEAEKGFPSALVNAVVGPASGVYSGTQVLLPTSLASGPVVEYRFKGQESWFVFDRPVYLSAFAGEERTYAIDFRSAESGLLSTLTYTIDMQAPDPPFFDSPPGDIESVLSLSLTGSGQIFVSIDGKPFEKYNPNDIRHFAAPPDATLTVRAVAYSADSAGNTSRTSAAIWRLSPQGIEPSFPLLISNDNLRVTMLENSPANFAEIIDLVGSARLTVKVPDDAIPLAAVNILDPSASLAAFAELSGSQAATSCIVPFPWGYEKEITVHYGYKRAGTLYIHPVPLRIKPRFPTEDSIVAPLASVPPKVRFEASTAFIEWPSSPWMIFVAFGNNDFTLYESPVALPLSEKPITFRYYSLGHNGARSATALHEIPSYRESITPEIAGVDDGRVYGTAVSVASIQKSAILYEFSEGDAFPHAVTPESPKLDTTPVRFEGRAGELVRYRMRLVTGLPDPGSGSQGTSVPSERFISFSIDRKPPETPKLAEGSQTYSASDSVVSFMPGSGNIFISVSEDGNGPFAQYNGPTIISGSDDGRKRYVIRAYAEDEFGNRSAEMQARHILIDRSSLYADPGGRPGASGSPDDPVAFLDDAVSLALSSGKKFIYIRGSMVLRKPVQIMGKLTISGGFDENWNESPSSMASIVIHFDSAQGVNAFKLDKGALSFSAVAISMFGDGASGLVDSHGGTLFFSNSTIDVSGGIEMVAIRASGASVNVSSSTIKLSDTVTGRGVDVNGGQLGLHDVSISCNGTVRMLDAVRVTDSNARIVGLRLDASPAQAMSGLNASRSSVTVERSVFSIRGGASSCRMFGASASSLSVSSTYLDTHWDGSCEVFSASNKATVSVAHVSAIVSSPRSVFMGASGSSYKIHNSIATFYGNSSVFVRSDSPVVEATIGANCLWGFNKLLDGASNAVDLSELNRFAASGKPNLSEDPSKIFYGEVKGLQRLSKSSICVDAGTMLEWGSMLDLLGSPRVSRQGKSLPDIGAEEL
jgi:hypothetical protein